MESVSVPFNPESYFINNKALYGATGELYCRPYKELHKRSPKGSVPVERLIFRLVLPETHYDELHGIFSNKQVFIFEVHRHLNPMLTVTAVLSEVTKGTDGNIECIVEFGGLS